MSDVNRINAIRRMYNEPKGSQTKLDSGECIHNWVLFDEAGTVVDHWVLDNLQVVEAYNKNTIWMGGEYEKIG